MFDYIKNNLDEVNQEIKSLAKKEVLTVCAVKYATDQEFVHLTQNLGQKEIGENRVQQLLSHYALLEHPEQVHWHFIGTLQKNKVKYIADKVCLIHSVDSLSLALEIEKQMAKLGKNMDVLVEINSGEEESKSGVSFDGVLPLCQEIIKLPHLCLKGFMTMAPKCDEQQSFAFFAKTVEFCLDIWNKLEYNNIMPIFSMGMSESYRPAILAGSDMVRIGRKLFEKKEEGR